MEPPPLITINSSSLARIAQSFLKSAGSGKSKSVSTKPDLLSTDSPAKLKSLSLPAREQEDIFMRRSVSDAISMAQAAEAGVLESADILEQLSELAEYVLEGMSDEDHDAIRQEVERLKAGVNNIATGTQFGGNRLLDGSSGELEFQVSKASDDTISLTIESLRTQDLGGGLQDARLTAVDDRGRLANAVVWSNLALNIPAGSPVKKVMDEISLVLSEEGVEADVLLAQNQGNQLDIIGHREELDKIAGLDARNALTVDSITLATRPDASKALLILDEAQAQLDAQLNELEAVQDDLDSAIGDLTAFEGDTIDSKESAGQVVDRVRQQMLEDMSASVLAQARGIPRYSAMVTSAAKR